VHLNELIFDLFTLATLKSRW